VLGRLPLGSLCAPPADRCTTTAGGWVSRPLMEARRGGGCCYRRRTGVKQSHTYSHTSCCSCQKRGKHSAQHAAALSTSQVIAVASAGALTYPLALPSPVHVLPHSLSELLHSRGALSAAGRPWSRGSACTCKNGAPSREDHSSSCVAMFPTNSSNLPRTHTTQKKLDNGLTTFGHAQNTFTHTAAHMKLHTRTHTAARAHTLHCTPPQPTSGWWSGRLLGSAPSLARRLHGRPWGALRGVAGPSPTSAQFDHDIGRGGGG
jgi:hypothetical protein